MGNQKARRNTDNDAPVIHGAEDLPMVTVSSYNLELRNRQGFIGDRANKAAFRETLDAWRMRIRKGGDDPLGEVPTDTLSKKEIDALLKDGETEAAALVRAAVDDFAAELADVLMRYLREDAWKGTERIAVGGGFKDSKTGLMAIARAQLLLKAEGVKVRLSPIAHHPDEAGLIGAVHLIPAWMLKGHDAILAVDIGGTNIRAGVVKLNLDDAEDFSKANVWKSELWRHADDEPKRTATIEYLVRMIETLIGKAKKAKLALAPVIGIGCPGIIAADGSIARGGQNLPGGNWESTHFNLPEALRTEIPDIGGQPTFVIMHNDAVVQGLSEVPRMTDIKTWAAVTIGTGLGNVSFVNKIDKKSRTK
ncbi:ROK family protein [Shinella curvata]|uniref:ROK family protein n=1 Tax=Shinella curvata TaxID=1817964 RepID=A0ABT8XK31_9HYPH|nr:ROK family protein [Shinella curvata]MCJ8052541.1 ROK family protein [Shinella curvata]MDO6123621.1 ROK family protein [Shinella curvata]